METIGSRDGNCRNRWHCRRFCHIVDCLRGCGRCLLPDFKFHPRVIWDLGLEVNIYNWSKKEEWDIVEWHSDNALINNTDSASQPFKEAKLKAVLRTFAMILIRIFTDRSDFLFVQARFHHRAAFLFPQKIVVPHMLPTPSKMESIKIMKFKSTSSTNDAVL